VSKSKSWSFKFKGAEHLETVYVHKSNKGFYSYRVVKKGKEVEIYHGKQQLGRDGLKRKLRLTVPENTSVPEFVEMIKLQEPVAPDREIQQTRYSL